MTTTTEQPVSLEICVDCLFLLANGTVSDDQDDAADTAHAARMDAIWGEGTEITLGHLAEACPDCGLNDDRQECDCEPWFSWSQCDGCGSTLGGDREHATAWVRA